MSPKETAYIVERLAVRFMSMVVADYERKMVEHRDAFGVRTSADAKIIDGMRAEVEDLRSRLNALGIQAAKQAGEALGMVEGEGLLGAARRVVKERDGLLTQVQDMRAEIERLQWENKTMQKDAEDGYAEAIKVLGDPIALSKERDALRAEVADLRGIVDMVHASLGIKRGDHIGKAIEALKSQSTPTTKQHPVNGGEWVRKTTDGLMYKIGDTFRLESYEIKDGQIWCNLDNGASWLMSVCEPCDPPVDHDTPAGKAVAEAVVQDERCGEIAVGDMIEGLFDDTKITVRREPDQNHGSRIVISDANDMGEANIYLTESGARQMATALIGLCDVRKVPQ